MTVFNPKAVDHTTQPMFFGEALGIQRFDTMAYPIFDKLTQKQLGYFWRPEEINLQKDRGDYQKMQDVAKFIFTENISYQIYSDSVQGRAPVIALLPYISVPELEACVVTWNFFETLHSRAYTHILKNIFPNPSTVFDKIISNENIIKRSKPLTDAYDDFIKIAATDAPLAEKQEKLYLAIMHISILEGIRFYSSFAVTFAFGEMKVMEGSAKEIKFIARDEAQHYAITQHILKIWAKDPAMVKIAKKCSKIVEKMFLDAVDAEKDWVDHLFSKGSILGINSVLLKQYIEWIANKRLKNIGLDALFPDAPKQNPLPYTEDWLSNKSVQAAPQETEISSYTVGGIDNDISEEMMGSFTL